MKKLLSKYSLMSAAALCSVSSQADIVYTDVDPDATFSGPDDEYEIDMNDDGQTDFTITNSSASFSFPGFFSIKGNGVNIAPASGNGILAQTYVSTTYYGSLSTNTEMAPIKANQTVSADKDFISSSGALLGYFKGSYGGSNFTVANGNFNDTIFDRFMGVKFDVGSDTYYGWVRISVQAELTLRSFTVFDYAYEDSGESILAGAGIISPGTLSLEDNALNSVKVTAANGHVYISSDQHINGTTTIHSITGALTTTEKMVGRESVINVPDYKQGAYIVRIQTDEGYEISKKIIL